MEHSTSNPIAPTLCSAPFSSRPIQPSREQEWLPYRDIIIDLFDNQNLTLPEVKKYMKETFNVEASLDKYKHRLHRDWIPFRNTQKYNDKQAMRAMALIMSHEAKLGRDDQIHFKYRGKHKSPAEVRRYWKRKRMSIEEVADTTVDIPYPNGLELHPYSIISSAPSTPDAYFLDSRVKYMIRSYANHSYLSSLVSYGELPTISWNVDILTKSSLTKAKIESVASEPVSLGGLLLVLWRSIAVVESEAQLQNIYTYLSQVGFMFDDSILGPVGMRKMLSLLFVCTKARLKWGIECVMRMYIDSVREVSKPLSPEFLWLVINDVWVSHTTVEQLEQLLQHQPSTIASFHLMRAYVAYGRYEEAVLQGLQLFRSHKDWTHYRNDIPTTLLLLTVASINCPKLRNDPQLKPILALTAWFWLDWCHSASTEGSYSRRFVPLGLSMRKIWYLYRNEQVCVHNLMISAWNSVSNWFTQSSDVNSDEKELKLSPPVDILVRSFEDQFDPGTSSLDSAVDRPVQIVKRSSSQCLVARLERAARDLRTTLAETKIAFQSTKDVNSPAMRLATFLSQFENRLQLLQDSRDELGNYLSEDEVTKKRRELWMDYGYFRLNSEELIWFSDDLYDNEHGWSDCIFSGRRGFHPPGYLLHFYWERPDQRPNTQNIELVESHEDTRLIRNPRYQQNNTALEDQEFHLRMNNWF